jgi:hypothetical protein
MNGNDNYSTGYEYKSRGERTIATFLDSVKLKYNYEPGVLVNDNGYKRIWYPDFGLPKYDVFIEYFGMENDPVYDERTRHKLKTFRNNDIDVISVYPSTLRGDYKEYILNELHQNVSGRMSDLEQTIANYSSHRNPPPMLKFPKYGFCSSKY